jgi:hypothetical protein
MRMTRNSPLPVCKPGNHTAILVPVLLCADMMGEYDQDYEPAWCLDAEDLGRLLLACPALCSLALCHVLQPGDLSCPLLDLPASCTRLIVSGKAFNNSAAAAVLCRLTQLQRLTWDDSTWDDSKCNH